MTSEQRAQLIEAALEARRHAYEAYSQFAVGAALLAKDGLAKDGLAKDGLAKDGLAKDGLSEDGEVFLGCNVENASYGLTICAERNAVASAVVAGNREFGAIAIASKGGVAPCGACRQVLAEFCQDLPILLIDVDRGNAVSEVRLAQLLPNRFTSQSMDHRDA